MMALLSSGVIPSCSKYEAHFNPQNDVDKDGIT